MAKKYRIDIIVNNAMAEAAGRRGADAFRGQEKAAKQAGDAAESASDRAVKAAQKRADKLEAIESAFLVRDYKARVTAEEKKQKAAEATAASATTAAAKKAAQIEAIESAFIARDYRARVAAEEKKQKAIEAAAEKKAKAVSTAITDEELATKVSNAKIVNSNDEKIRLAMQGAGVQHKNVIRMITDEEVSRRVANQKIINSNTRRTEEAMKAAGVEYKGLRNGWEGAERLTKSIVGLAAGYASVHVAVQLITALGDATREAAEAQKKHSDEYFRYLEMQRESLDMSGKGVNKKTLMEAAQFEVDTGMTADEANAYKKAFQGRGAQFEGKTMSAAAHKEHMLQGAKLALATGIQPDVIGDLAGLMSGSKDFTKDAQGKPVSDKEQVRQALASTNQILAILQHGAGENKSIVKQASTVASFAMNPDEHLGVFNGKNMGRDMATATSIAAEVNPEESAAILRASIKAIRPDVGDKAHNAFMKKAGITPQDSYFVAYEKMAKVAQKEAQAQNIDLGQVLQNNGLARLEGTAAAAMINKGVLGGGFKERQDFGDKVANPAVVQDKIARSETNPETGINRRKSEAKLRMAGHKVGAESADAADLLIQAEAELVASRQATESWKDKAVNLTYGAAYQAFGGLPRQGERRTEKAEEIIQRRAKAQGIVLPPDRGPVVANDSVMNLQRGVQTSEARGDYFRRRENAFLAQGGTSLQDLTKEQVAINRQILEELKKKNGRPLPVGANVGAGMAR